MYISSALVAASVLLAQVGVCHGDENLSAQTSKIIDPDLVKTLFTRSAGGFRSKSKAKTGLGFQHGGGASFINPKKLFVLISQLTKGIENNKIAITYLQNELKKQKSKNTDCTCVGEKGDKGEKGIPGPIGVPGARGMTVEHYHKSKN